MIWILGVCLVAFSVISAFVVVATFKKVVDAGRWVPWYMKVIAYVWLVIGLPSDVLFNWIFGTWIFREFPRELMFTARVKRHYYTGSGWREQKAGQWAELLNDIDAGHV